MSASWETDPLPIGTAARFINHQGFIGTVRAVPESETFFDCWLELADGREIGARWFEIEATP